jgi:membrane-bound lytic murein transglycosylase B
VRYGLAAQRVLSLALAVIVLCAAGCAHSPPPTTSSGAKSPSTTSPATMPPSPTAPPGAQPRLAADPARLADDLVADQRALSDPSAPESTLTAAARRQQAAYRAIGRHREWDGTIRARIPAELLERYDLNVDARRQLTAIAEVRTTLPAWRISAPAPAEELLGYYHAAESETAVGWNYLAAINFIETRLGSIEGTSTAGAQGPMQFLPSTFAGYGAGGDIHSPRDSILAAGRYLAANGFAADHDRAIYRYNHADEYVRAVDDYAAALATDPTAFTGYYRWEVYCYTGSGDVLLPIGYAAAAPIPVTEYLTAHPQ